MKHTKKHNKRKATKQHRSKTRKVKTGGKAMGSGGFGCVFSPPLKCKKRNTRLETDMYVTKLMTTKHANSEFNTIKKVLQILKDIPNYQRYFLVDDVHKCKPSELSSEDMINFDKQCKPLKKHDDLTSNNVNENLDKLEALILPNGGVTIDSYYKYMTTKENFNYINYQLIDLLFGGVIPMNDLHMFHADLKESNILYNLTTFTISIIDWGLAFKYTRGKLPRLICNKPLQYNLPFSTIFFNTKFDNAYISFMKNFNEGDISPDEKNFNTMTEESRHVLSSFVYDYVDYHNEWRGKGHYDTIEKIWSHVSSNKPEEYHDSKEIIIVYLVNILLYFTKNGRFERERYFQNVFLKNMDIWGMLMCYSPILEENLFEKSKNISELYNNHLLLTWGEPIDIHALKEDLDSLTFY